MLGIVIDTLSYLETIMFKMQLKHFPVHSRNVDLRNNGVVFTILSSFEMQPSGSRNYVKSQICFKIIAVISRDLQ